MNLILNASSSRLSSELHELYEFGSRPLRQLSARIYSECWARRLSRYVFIYGNSFIKKTLRLKFKYSVRWIMSVREIFLKGHIFSGGARSKIMNNFCTKIIFYWKKCIHLRSFQNLRRASEPLHPCDDHELDWVNWYLTALIPDKYCSNAPHTAMTAAWRHMSQTRLTN